jgi:cytochrome P450
MTRRALAFALPAAVVGGTGLCVTAEPPADHHTFVAVLCGVAAVLLSVALTVATYSSRATNHLQERITAPEAEAARLADETIPAAVTRLRDGGSVDTVLSELAQPTGKAHEQVLRTLVQEISASERMRASAMAACANAAGRVQARATSQLPLRVVTRLYGLDTLESAALQNDIVELANESADTLAAYQRMHNRMAALVADVRRVPVPGIPAVMASHPAGLTDDEIVNDLIGVVYASHQPTTDWIGNALRLMLTDERFTITMAGGRASVGRALNEVLWEDTPVPNFIGRWAAEDTLLGGQHIRKGDCLVLGLAAANADPSIRPGSWAGSTGNQAHMAFSHGEHGCPEPARELAEVMSMTAIEVLIDRLPDVTLTIPPTELEWRSSALMHGVGAIPVQFSPALRG